MNEAAIKYLSFRFRRDILHEKMGPEPRATVSVAEIIPEIEGELARINSLRLGPHLANRDFGLYQRKQFLESVLDEVQVSGKLKAKEQGSDTALFTKPP